MVEQRTPFLGHWFITRSDYFKIYGVE